MFPRASAQYGSLKSEGTRLKSSSLCMVSKETILSENADTIGLCLVLERNLDGDMDVTYGSPTSNMAEPRSVDNATNSDGV